jgi:hypothetical protein
MALRRAAPLKPPGREVLGFTRDAEGAGLPAVEIVILLAVSQSSPPAPAVLCHELSAGLFERAVGCREHRRVWIGMASLDIGEARARHAGGVGELDLADAN